MAVRVWMVLVSIAVSVRQVVQETDANPVRLNPTYYSLLYSFSMSMSLYMMPLDSQPGGIY